MAGHSQFKNIMYRKGAQDAKRAKVFTKLIRELSVAARHNADPEANPRLRSAITAARQANMPKDTMERAIHRGAGAENADNFEEMRYEGYGPGGVAIIIEALTDNRNRTAPEIRTIFSKNGGTLGETNSVSFNFEHVGLILYNTSQVSYEALLEAALEIGVEDLIEEESQYVLFCPSTQLHQSMQALTQSFGDPEQASLYWRPLVTVPCQQDVVSALEKLVQMLEDNDDVQRVFTNLAEVSSL